MAQRKERFQYFNTVMKTMKRSFLWLLLSVEENYNLWPPKLENEPGATYKPDTGEGLCKPGQTSTDNKEQVKQTYLERHDSHFDSEVWSVTAGGGEYSVWLKVFEKPG